MGYSLIINKKQIFKSCNIHLPFVCVYFRDYYQYVQLMTACITSRCNSKEVELVLSDRSPVAANTYLLHAGLKPNINCI